MMGILYRSLRYVCIILFITLALGSVSEARQTYEVIGSNGNVLFLFDIYEKGDTWIIYEDGKQGKEKTQWTLDANHLGSLQYAGEYWSSLVGNLATNTSAVRVAVAALHPTDEIGTAAFSEIVTSGAYAGYTELAANVLFNQTMPTAKGDSTGIILCDTPGSSQSDYFGPMQVLPHNGKTEHLASVVAHELGHAFGLTATVDTVYDIYDNAEYFFKDQLNNFERHLVDSFGEKAEPGMEVIWADYARSGTFVVDDHAFFQGPITMQVLSGAILDNNLLTGGIPINGFEDGEPELSHMELKNSMMSHQSYRNYTGFMEAELAIFKDIGFALDLKDHFGYSIYTSGLVDFENTNGYFARNSDGSAYVEGKYNQTFMGIGLHIYGAGNTITQKADILSEGFGGAGIRMDGWRGAVEIKPGEYEYVYGNNHLTIDNNVRVHSNGERGTGLMVAYGKEHVLVNRGDVAAVGYGGVAARFDFGGNLLGSDYANAGAELRGSYIFTKWVYDEDEEELVFYEQYPDLAAEALDGALADRFDVSGRLHGHAAAIYISDNAYVKEINIMNGADLKGDIISDWDPGDSRIQHAAPETLLTTLTFGRQSDPLTGEVIALSADPDFHLRYRGNITGEKSFVTSVVSGTLDFAGTAKVKSFSLESGATLLTWFHNGAPTNVNGEEIVLAAGSQVGLTPDAFAYGGPAATGKTTVLELGASTLLSNSSDVATSSGRYAVGVYDYFYDTLDWNDAGNRLAANVFKRKFNHERGGTAAVTAPLAMLAHNPAGGVVRNRTVSRFADGMHKANSTGNRALLYLAQYQNGAGTSAYGPALIRTGQESSRTAASSRQPLKDEQKLQWLSLAEGGALSGAATGIWVTPGYHYTHQTGRVGYDIKGPNVSFGVDHLFHERFFLGLAVSLDFPEYESSHADIDGNAITGTLYGGLLLPQDVEFGFFGSYGKSDYDQTRKVYGRKFDADYDSENYSLGASLGRTFYSGEDLALRPFLSYEYIHLDTDGYKEKGDMYALKFTSSENNLHRVEAGLDASYSFENGAYLAGRLYYSGLYGDREGDTKTHFVYDAARTSFKVTGDSLDEHSLGAGVGIGLPLNDTLDVTLGYNFLGGDDSRTHQGSLGIRLQF